MPSREGNSRISQEVLRSDRTQRNYGYRSGYWHYDSRWRDDYFWFSHYRFDWRPGYCVPSPWYFYPSLPGYIVQTSVITINTPWNLNFSVVYDWRQPSRGGWWDDDTSRPIDYAIGDIVDAFRYRDSDLIRRMVDPRGRVVVEVAGDWRYAMRGSDFMDLFDDVVMNVRTRGYRIRDVRTRGNQVMVRADHQFTDPFGSTDVARHTYVLEYRGRGYELVFFRTDREAGW